MNNYSPHNSVLIFSGYNYRGVIAFCRFCKENNIKFSIVASSKEDKLLISQYKKNVIAIRKSKQLLVEEFQEFSELMRNKFIIEKIIIIPSTEFLNRFLLQNRKKLEAQNFVIPLCSSKLYKKISDKFSFSELCKVYKIKIPKEYYNIKEASFPLVIKPKKYFGDNKLVNLKPQIINSKNELNNLDQEKNNSKYYYQEYIGGRSFYLLYFVKSNGKFSVFSQENLIQQSNGLSIIAAVSSDIHKKAIAKQYAKLLVSEGFAGLIMIEIKKHNDQFYMIEANPRLWGPSQLIIDSGMNLFHLFAIENGLLETFLKLEYSTGVYYLWSGGIIEDQKNNQNIVFHNYSPKKFFEGYYNWINCDILNRTDTKKIYESEIN